MTAADSVVAWTDGSCLGNPGPGGWATILVRGDEERDFAGGERETTNNRMEMMAALAAMENAPAGVALVLTSDSQYLRDGITKWIVGWKRKGWRTAAGDPVKNQDLWKRLDEARTRHGNVRWEWVKGHAGTEMNERVDVMARTQAKAFQRA